MFLKVTYFIIQILISWLAKFLPNLVCQNDNILIFVNINENFGAKNFPDDSILVQAMEKDRRIPIVFDGVFHTFLIVLTPL